MLNAPIDHQINSGNATSQVHDPSATKIALVKRYGGLIDRCISTFALQIICMENRQALQGSRMEKSGSFLENTGIDVKRKKFPRSIQEAKSDIYMSLQFIKSHLKSMIYCLWDDEHQVPVKYKNVEMKIIEELEYIEFSIPIIGKIIKVSDINIHVNKMEWFRHTLGEAPLVDKWQRITATLASVTPQCASGADKILSSLHKSLTCQEANKSSDDMQKVAQFSRHIDKCITVFALQIISIDDLEPLSAAQNTAQNIMKTKGDLYKELILTKKSLNQLTVAEILPEIEYIDFCLRLINATNEDILDLFEIFFPTISKKKSEKVISLIYTNKNHAFWLKHALKLIPYSDKWIRFINAVAPSEGINYSTSSISRTQDSIKADRLNQREILNLRKKLKLMKIAKWLAEIDGKCISNQTRLKMTKLKCQIAFLEGPILEYSSKGTNGALFVHWRKRDSSLRKIAVLKESRSTKKIEIPQATPTHGSGFSLLNNVVQAIGYYTNTSQQAVVSGAASTNKEACAEKAAFMMAEQLLQILTTYTETRKIQHPEESRLLYPEMFTPMIAGIASLLHGNRDKTSVGSIAVYSAHSIDANIMQDIVPILDKTLDASEILIYQLFTLFDYLLGNTDRHLGNWMVKLSYNDFFGTVNLVKNHDHLHKLVHERYMRKEDFKIVGIIPIDNGNILPTQDLYTQDIFGTIVDLKQYDWRSLKFSQEPFHAEIIDFIKSSALSKKWAIDLCDSINTDEEIIKYSNDMQGPFINKKSLYQLCNRIENIISVGKGKITTPKALAQA
jgi:hypothetical protein